MRRRCWVISKFRCSVARPHHRKSRAPKVICHLNFLVRWRLCAGRRAIFRTIQLLRYISLASGCITHRLRVKRGRVVHICFGRAPNHLASEMRVAERPMAHGLYHERVPKGLVGDQQGTDLHFVTFSRYSGQRYLGSAEKRDLSERLAERIKRGFSPSSRM